jgi:hypothetical protein
MAIFILFFQVALKAARPQRINALRRNVVLHRQATYLPGQDIKVIVPTWYIQIIVLDTCHGYHSLPKHR